MSIISKLKAVLSLDDKQFKAGLKGAEKSTKGFGDSIGKLGGIIGAAFSVQQIAKFAIATAELGHQATNVDKAFSKLGITLESLKTATGGGIGDLRLQQMAVQAANLGLDVDKLATAFEFATIRAAETGESVDYLVNSIVTGIGRKSILIMDNLGISQAALNAEIKKGATFAEAANTIIQRELEASTVSIQNAVSGVQRFEASWLDLQTEMGKGGVSKEIQQVAEILAGLVTTITSNYGAIERTMDILSFVTPLFWLKEYSVEFLKLIGSVERLKTITPDWIKTAMGGDEALGEFAGMPAVSTAAAPVTDTDLGGPNWESMGDLLDQFNAEHKDFTDSIIAQNAAMMESFDFAEEDFIDDITQFYVEVADSLDKVTMSALEASFAFSNLGMAFADSLSNMVASLQSGNDVLGAIGNFIVQLAGLMMEFAVLLGLFGVGTELLESGNPYAMIAGALVIAGTAIAIAGSISSMSAMGSTPAGSAGGGYSGGSYGGGTYGGGYDYNREIILVARGEDLVGVINRQSRLTDINGG